MSTTKCKPLRLGALPPADPNGDLLAGVINGTAKPGAKFGDNPKSAPLVHVKCEDHPYNAGRKRKGERLIGIPGKMYHKNSRFELIADSCAEISAVVYRRQREREEYFLSIAPPARA